VVVSKIRRRRETLTLTLTLTLKVTKMIESFGGCCTLAISAKTNIQENCLGLLYGVGTDPKGEFAPLNDTFEAFKEETGFVQRRTTTPPVALKQFMIYAHLEVEVASRDSTSFDDLRGRWPLLPRTSCEGEGWTWRAMGPRYAT